VYFSLANFSELLAVLLGRTPESWNIGKMFGGIWKIT
jgi:hypothetical protein